MGRSLIEVVVVDNSTDLCDVIKEIVDSQPDMKVLGVAHNGLDAIDVIQRTTPDVVVLDVVMPYLDGLGVMGRLREIALEPTPQIIVLTAFEQQNVIRECMQLGASYYILKPFDYDGLVDTIRRLGRAPVVKSTGSVVGRAISPQKGASNGVSLDSMIIRLLHDIGMPTHLKGYMYILDAITRVVEDFSILTSVTKMLYPVIAGKFGTTTHGVEAAIRHTIQKAWKEGDADRIKALFGTSESEHLPELPTNTAFIARVAEILRISGY